MPLPGIGQNQRPLKAFRFYPEKCEAVFLAANADGVSTEIMLNQRYMTY